MRPTSTSSARRGRGGNSARRNAFTNAGVNRAQSSDPRRSRPHNRRRTNNYHDGHHGPATSRSSLASRITYSEASAQDQVYRSRANNSHHQSSDGDDDPGFSIRGRANFAGSVNSHDLVQPEHNATRAGAATMNDFDAEEDVDIDIDGMLLNCNTQQMTSLSQQSALFCGSQPTQPTEPLPPLSPSLAASTFASRPSAPSRTSNSLPIRMLNQPLHDPNGSPDFPNNVGRPKRPINTYRGKDPIKRLVQNKKLQAIFADRPIPKERTKSDGERMELRMGMRSVSK